MIKIRNGDLSLMGEYRITPSHLMNEERYRPDQDHTTLFSAADICCYDSHLLLFLANFMLARILEWWYFCYLYEAKAVALIQHHEHDELQVSS